MDDIVQRLPPKLAKKFEELAQKAKEQQQQQTEKPRRRRSSAG
jgi:hypothetical protein